MNKRGYFYALIIVGLFFSWAHCGQAAKSTGDEPGGQTINNTINNTFIDDKDSDVIAVRVLPNPNHYSAARWYKSQGFSGSPQALLVDGYDAVRDGRTVYVNAANVDLATKNIYTNIYLISYNQNPQLKTVDVLGQIISHWRFNSNLTTAGNCYISTLLCENDNDCSQGQYCFGKTEAPGRCRPQENSVCYTDADCTQGLYCDSLRAKVARDVRRLRMLGDLRESLSAFKKINNKYPILGAGTYLPLSSISVWPSWQSLFLPQLGMPQSLIDPINKLGPCAGYNSETCWNEETKAFADPNPQDNNLELPGGSYAFVYSGDSNGSNYTLCAAMETKSLGYNTTEGQLAESGCVSSGAGYIGSGNNLAPVLIATNLQGQQDQEFNGFIKVIDPDGNPMDWSINTAATVWTNWRNNGQNNVAPIMLDTSNPHQKKIYAQAAGNPGTYNLSLSVADGQGGVLSTVTPITIVNTAPLIQSDDIYYYPSTVIPLTINFSLSDKDQPISYTITKATWNSGPYDLLAPANATFLSESHHQVGDTVYYTLKYNLHTSNKFTHDTTFVYVITAKDKYNNTATRQLNINIKIDPPVLDFNCASSVRVGSYYSCRLGFSKQGDHTITYRAVGSLPSGLSIGEVMQPGGGVGGGSIQASRGSLWRFISKLSSWFKAAEAAVANTSYALQGTPTTAASAVSIKIKAENEFGAVSEREFLLNINNYCGDGVRQAPNSEGRGGFYNDGHEDCDGNSGIISDRSQIGSTSPTLQYGCTTKLGGAVPYPIMNTYYCIYLSADDPNGGGYCGDGICQARIIRNNQLTPWEIGGYCLEDCTCAGDHLVPVGDSCECETGWYDCDSEALGCESEKPCDGCGADQYECGNQCFSKNSFDCGLYSSKCYSNSGTSCTTSCPSGYYNCNGTNECESTSCVCPDGQHWEANVWPDGACVANTPAGCPNGMLQCGTTGLNCYNPDTQQCCSNSTVCGINQYCCNVSSQVLTCVNNYVTCYIIMSGGNSGAAN
ncbi:MAG TPA: dickkopf-related protein [bacterium]|mgnify:FL=1|nr:dickkopf-related protein [bacterium]